MSQSMMEAFVRGQYKAMTAKDNKERLRYAVAGCKDGHLYNHSGTDFGLFNEDAPDAEFITEKDLTLSRITGSKLQQIADKMEKFFATYGSNSGEQVEDEPTKDAEAGTDLHEDESETDDVTFDVESAVKACKKAIKKGNDKKALKLIASLEDAGFKKEAKKLSKKMKG